MTIHESLSRLLACASISTRNTKRPASDLPRLAELMEASPQALYNWKKRGVSKEAALKAATVFGCNPVFVLDGVGEPFDDMPLLPAGMTAAQALDHPELWDADMMPKIALAQPASYQPIKTAVPLSWEQVMSEDRNGTLPLIFLAVAPDDAMSPLARKGDVLHLNRGHQPRYGDGVIVRDSNGALHLRQYTEGETADNWLARPKKGHYRTLEKIKDGLEIVGVVRVPESGWADFEDR